MRLLPVVLIFLFLQLKGMQPSSKNFYHINLIVENLDTPQLIDRKNTSIIFAELRTLLSLPVSNSEIKGLQKNKMFVAWVKQVAKKELKFRRGLR